MLRVYDMSSGQVLETHLAASCKANQTDAYRISEWQQLQLYPRLPCEDRQLLPGLVVADLNAFFKKMS